jgi:hypothetical protein
VVGLTLFFLVVQALIIFRTSCDIVDIQIVVGRAPVFIRVVETADWTFFDWTFWTALLFARRLALVLRRRIRTEVPAPSG